MKNFIYHITTGEQWSSAQAVNLYTPENYDQDGFIHCSDANQVLRTVTKFYQNVPDLILLQIACNRVKAKIVWENLDRQPELFPHIYGKLNLDSVVGFEPFLKNADGFFILPHFLNL